MTVLIAAIVGAVVVLTTFGIGFRVGRQSIRRGIVPPAGPIEVVEAAIKTATVDALHGKLSATSSRESN